MRITIHQYTDLIDGCITEYESNGWKLFVGYEEQLPCVAVPEKTLEIEGLTYGDLSKSALLITHYHGNHIDKIADLSPELPVFMSKISKEIAQKQSTQLSPGSKKHRSTPERIDPVTNFVPGEQFFFGEFSIMPIIIDHSTYEVYAFHISTESLKVLHTSDFCMHSLGRGKLSQGIKQCIGKVDYVVCEATNVNYPDITIHCHMVSLNRLLDKLNPKAIIPIHSDNPRRFADLFCEKWPVIILEDGESFAAIRDSGFDTITANIIALQAPDNSYEIIDNPENLRWWMVDNRFLGEFQRWDDADSALHHVVYAPERLLGYTIESDEDMTPFLYVVYNKDFTEHSEYHEGCHVPNDEANRIDCGYAPGQRVRAIIDRMLVPCEVIGPLTVDYLRKSYNESDTLSEEDFQKYKSELWDWDWDKIVVHPLVKIKTEYGEISSDTTVPRIYIFPI